MRLYHWNQSQVQAPSESMFPFNFLRKIYKMLESTGCLLQSQHHCRWVLRRFKRTILFLLSVLVMAESFEVQLHSEQTPPLANLGIQDQSCNFQNCRNFPSPHFRLFQSTFAGEVNSSRDVTSREVVETGLLGEDGSMPGTYFLAWNESDAGVELLPLVVENIIANSSSRFVPQEKVTDVTPCKESMEDLLPPRQKETGAGSCVVVVPSRYVRQYKWPLSQLKVDDFISI